MTTPLQRPRALADLDHFRDDVLAGLAATPKSIPPRYFYDGRGAELFEAICELPEYYPTRIERDILTAHALDIARAIGPGAQLMELGGGNLAKARIILSSLVEPASFVAIDISAGQLRASTRALLRDFPRLEIVGVATDFMRDFDPPRAARPHRRRVAMFLGSSIGNLLPDEAIAFMRRVGRIIGPAGAFLVGVDLDKDTSVLNAAYNDAAGVTAMFNLNLLDRINRELGGDFERQAFQHRAFHDRARGRVEMHLVSRRAQIATVAGRVFKFDAGETIHTENSYKYTIDGFRRLARRAGLLTKHVWTDAAGWFSVHHLENE